MRDWALRVGVKEQRYDCCLLGDKQRVGVDRTRCRYEPPTTLMLRCGPSPS